MAVPGPRLARSGGIKRRLPDAAREHLAAGRCDALMVHWRLVTARLVEAVGEAGGELYVWTVDDAARIRRLEAMGVTGVITNDPRLFGRLRSLPCGSGCRSCDGLRIAVVLV